MKKHMIVLAAVGVVAALPTLAHAAAVRGYSTADVNMRSGPSTAYPAVSVIPDGEPLRINGCMSEVNWCDVSWIGGRGWVYGHYVQAEYQSKQVYIEPIYYPRLGIPVVQFEVDTYWSRHYRDRGFYGERARWRRHDWREGRYAPGRW